MGYGLTAERPYSKFTTTTAEWQLLACPFLGALNCRVPPCLAGKREGEKASMRMNSKLSLLYLRGRRCNNDRAFIALYSIVLY